MYIYIYIYTYIYIYIYKITYTLYLVKLQHMLILGHYRPGDAGLGINIDCSREVASLHRHGLTPSVSNAKAEFTEMGIIPGMT